MSAETQVLQQTRGYLQGSLYKFLTRAFPIVDPDQFVEGKHLSLICDRLQAISKGERNQGPYSGPRRILFNVPPRTAKSLTCSVIYPAWVWAQKPFERKLHKGEPLPLAGPHVRILATSYDSALSTRDNLKMRNLLRSQWYQQYWGKRFFLVGDQDAKTRFNNSLGGFRQSTSVSGLATGEGADLIIVDDPHNVKQAESQAVREETVRWFHEVLPTRLNDRKNGAIIVVMQRVHEADVSGYILANELGYEHVCLPALYESDHPYRYPLDWRTEEGQPLWPERPGFDEEGIAALATELGSYAAAGQLQQRPAPRGGGMFKPAWFPTIDALPAERSRVRAWDLAGTEALGYNTSPSATCGVLMSRDRSGLFNVEDVIVLRGSPQEVERTIINTARLDGVKTRIRLPQDPGQAGKAQAQYLIGQLAGYAVRAVPVTGAKETRASPMAAQAEVGNVRLLRAPWNKPYLDELSMFPSGAHNDQVDASADAFNELAQPRQSASIRDMF